MTHRAISLKPYHTFSLPLYAHDIVQATTQETLIASWRKATEQQQPVLMLGEGSNVLFLENFSGTVIVNRLKGIDIIEDKADWLVQVGAGENWHHLVEYSLQQGVAGLENLALIPGCVGSAPIQNIGAYGTEFKQFCDYVDLLDLANNQVIRLSAAECGFAYRESIFKHQYRDGFVIVAVGLRLSKTWIPVLEYGDLTRLDAASVTPRMIFDTVCEMRRTKLPDPQHTGNAGSFFKNPVVSAEQAQAILARYPKAPHYPQPDGDVKLAAGWLIDQCHLKGYQIGGAAVHQQQALVLINRHEASSDDVVSLARHIREQVAANFAVWLEPEVRFIGPQGEVNAIEVLS